MKFNRFHVISIILASLLIFPILLSDSVNAALVPDWIKNTAGFWANDQISDVEFLNAIKYLIENGIIEIPEPEEDTIEEDSNLPLSAEIIMPNGNAEQSNTGFYVPLHLQAKVGTTVVWVNDDNFPHTVQSQDEDGNPIGLFNSNVLNTGERFAFKFEESGDYDYFCTLHPWRVGQITIG